MPRASEATVRERLDELIADFDTYARAFDSAVALEDDRQFGSHRRIIQLRRELGSVDTAITNTTFVELLYRTIQQWGVGRRSSRIVSLPSFQATLINHRQQLAELDGLSIEDLGDDAAVVSASIDNLVSDLAIVENKARIVAGTKTLHHLLPDLVPPMDRAWTGAFFGWTSSDPQNNQTRIFERSFVGLAEVARTSKPTRFVGDGWRTCSTKILDNAVIGYCKSIGIGG